MHQKLNSSCLYSIFDVLNKINDQDEHFKVQIFLKARWYMICAAELIVKTEFTYSCRVWAKLSEAESFHIWQLLSWSWSEMVIFPPWLNQEDCSKKRDQWEEEPESVMSLSYLQSKSGAAVSVQHHNSETWSKKCSWFGYFTDIITDYLDNTQHESAEQTNKTKSNKVNCFEGKVHVVNDILRKSHLWPLPWQDELLLL